jgi:response regulator RpfG family c-di-GMP phosphodiesterase
VLQDRYTVCTAGSGQEALDLLARQEIAVILTDQRTPGLTGVQLLERAKHLSPATLGILSLGYSDSMVLSDTLNLGTERGFIPKPWNIAELRRQVDQVMREFLAPTDAQRSALYSPKGQP